MWKQLGRKETSHDLFDHENGVRWLPMASIVTKRCLCPAGFFFPGPKRRTVAPCCPPPKKKNLLVLSSIQLAGSFQGTIKFPSCAA